MTDRLEAYLRETLAGFDPVWSDEAIEKARETDDDEAAIRAVITVIQARARTFETEANAKIADANARIARINAANAAEAAAKAVPDRGIIH